MSWWDHFLVDHALAIFICCGVMLAAAMYWMVWAMLSVPTPEPPGKEMKR